VKIDIVSLFPEYFELSLRQSLLGKGLQKKLFEIEITDLRRFAVDRHRTVDDRPFGGTAGMVLKVDPLDRALAGLGHQRAPAGPERENESIILTSAAGRRFDQDMAKRYSMKERLTIICGHYLGVDERILELYDIDEVSIGDYTLSGGEPAALVMVDAVVRLLPGVLGNFESALNDSHMEPGLGSPHYTRPAEYEGLTVPEALTSGDHARIERFRRAAAIRKCLANRPDLLREDQLTTEERRLLDEFDNKK